MTTPVPADQTCEGCGAVLSAHSGPTHRYMASSPGCWAAFSALNDPHRPLAGTAFDALIVDAYAAQHPGRFSPQTINSVAIHLMVLYGVLEHGFRPEQALWLRQRPGRPSRVPRHDRFHWLTAPSFDRALTVADVSRGGTPAPALGARPAVDQGGVGRLGRRAPPSGRGLVRALRPE